MAARVHRPKIARRPIVELVDAIIELMNVDFASPPATKVSFYLRKNFSEFSLVGEGA